MESCCLDQKKKKKGKLIVLQIRVGDSFHAISHVFLPMRILPHQHLSSFLDSHWATSYQYTCICTPPPLASAYPLTSILSIMGSKMVHIPCPPATATGPGPLHSVTAHITLHYGYVFT
jgi:hypothetical protein